MSFSGMSVTAILDEAKQMPSEDLRSLILELTEYLDDETNAELSSILITRRRADELKSGKVKSLQIEEVFAKARGALQE
ncbi:MAG: hypothetical protein AAGH89_10325 [Verrucomicrobiota bacterium]